MPVNEQEEIRLEEEAGDPGISPWKESRTQTRMNKSLQILLVLAETLKPPWLLRGLPCSQSLRII